MVGRPADAVDGGELLDRLLSEKDFQAQIVALAKVCGWKVFHQFDSRRSEPGWPDLVLLRPQVALFVEVKRQNGRLTKAQRGTLDLLRDCGNLVDVWRPSDWDSIVRVLA